MLPLVLGGFLASFQVLASFFYHYHPENVWQEPHTYQISITQEPPYSMLPLYQPGDLVTVVPMYLDEVQPGRIIAFNGCLSGFYEVLGRGVHPYLHRVVSVGADERGWYAITKGDSLSERDVCKVREVDLLGIVPAKEQGK